MVSTLTWTPSLQTMTLAMCRSTTNPIANLTALLDAARGPLSLDEIARRLGLAPAMAAYLLAGARRRGEVRRTDSGGFDPDPEAAWVRRRPRLAGVVKELFEVVLACEAEWRLDDRLDLLGRIRPGRRG